MRQKGDDFFQNITIQSNDTCFPPEQLSSIIQKTMCREDSHHADNNDTEKQNNAAAWTERKAETVSDVSSGRSDQADVIAIYGSSYCILPFGRQLSIGDPDGCIISQRLADSLFGDFSAEGKQITWLGHTWTVRGIIHIPRHFLMVETDGKETALSFHRISIPLDTGMDRQSTGENFMLQHSLSARVLRLDYLYQWSWLKELIPGKWSDFGGWTQNHKDQAQAARFVRQTEHSTLEEIGLEMEQRGGLCLLAGLILCSAALLLLPPLQKGLPH